MFFLYQCLLSNVLGGISNREDESILAHIRNIVPIHFVKCFCQSTVLEEVFDSAESLEGLTPLFCQGVTLVFILESYTNTVALNTCYKNIN